MRSIKMNNNLIENIEDEAFVNLPKLIYLNLSSNKIDAISGKMFSSSIQLSLLSIMNNPLKTTDEKMFYLVKVDFIETQDYHVCFLVPSESKCPATKPWYRSHPNLLPGDALRWIFFSVSVLIILLNFACQASIFWSPTASRCFCIIVVSVNTTKLVSAIYYSVLWVADMTVESTFAEMDENWRSGPFCFAAINFYFWYSILIPVILLFMSLARTMVVVFPLNTSFKREKFIINCVAYMYLCSGCAGICLSVFVKFTEQTLPFSLCLPFLDPSHSIVTLKIVTWCVALLQATLSSAIAIIHCILVKTLKESQRSLQKSKYESSLTVIQAQLSVMSLSNMISWYPTMIFFLMSFFLSQYPADFVSWIVVAVAPANSIIYPLLLTITTIRQNTKDRGKSDLVNQQKT